MKTSGIKVVRICTIFIAVTSAVLLIYWIGFAAGFRAAEIAISDLDFYDLVNRVRLGITIGLIVSAFGISVNKTRGLLLSAVGLLWVIGVYVWWYLRTKAYVVNSEVTENTRLHDPYYRNLVFHGANWWDMLILALTTSMLIWTIVAVLRNKSKTLSQ